MHPKKTHAQPMISADAASDPDILLIAQDARVLVREVWPLQHADNIPRIFQTMAPLNENGYF